MRLARIAVRRHHGLGQCVVESIAAPWAQRPSYLKDGRLLGNDREGRLRTSGDQGIVKAVDVDAESSQHLTGQTLDIEHAEENAVGRHLRLSLLARMPARSFEGSLSPGRERQRFGGRCSGANGRYFHHLVTCGGETRTYLAQLRSRPTVFIGQEPEQ